MTILSIDLASRQSGVAAFIDKELVSSGVIEPKPKTLTASQRLPKIKKEVIKWLDRFNPDLVILETPAGGAEDTYSGPEKNWKTMSVLFLTHGAIQCELEERGIKFDMISSSTWSNRMGFFERGRKGRKDKAKTYAIEHYNVPSHLEQDIYDAIVLHDTWWYLQDYKDVKDEEVSAF